MNSLIADIGGTNTRCAITGPTGPAKVARYRNADYSDLGPLLVHYIGSLPADDRPAAAMLAVAGPVRGQEIHMTNLGWSFSTAALRDRLQLKRLQVLNDFQAQAYALPALGPDDLLQLGTGIMEADADRLVHRNAFNVTAMQLTPTGLAEEIRKHIPDFEIDYDVDPVRQAIADSWPDRIDDSAARDVHDHHS